MGTTLVSAHIVQSHFFFCATSQSLEKYRFSVATFGTGMIFRSRQRGIVNHVRHNGTPNYYILDKNGFQRNLAHYRNDRLQPLL
ncbi:hypothetical protein Bhyg_01135, partial [Pseudolycoriella hygida]